MTFIPSGKYSSKLTEEELDILERGFIPSIGKQITDIPIKTDIPQKTFLEKTGATLGTILGGEKIGEAIGTQAAKLGLTGLTPEQRKEVAPSPTAKQVVADIGQAGLTIGTLATGGIGAGIKGILGVGARALEAGVIGAAFKALRNISEEKPIKEGVGITAAITGAIPVTGAGLRAAKGLIRPTGEQIQKSLIRPLKADFEDGFKIENIRKYNLGGSLEKMLKNTETKLSELTQNLSQKIRQTDVVINLNNIAKRTAKQVLKEKGKIFGDVASAKKVLQNLAAEVEEQSTNGLVGLSEAQAIKQAAGKKGAWVFGFRDPDSTATERVYTTFYRELKQEIEKKAPSGLKEINKQISDLIPISHAIIRRIPVAQRQNLLSLTDIISGGFAIGNPSAIGLFALNRLSKSGTFAKFLTQIESKPAITKIGKRIFGK